MNPDSVDGATQRCIVCLALEGLEGCDAWAEQLYERQRGPVLSEGARAVLSEGAREAFHAAELGVATGVLRRIAEGEALGLCGEHKREATAMQRKRGAAARAEPPILAADCAPGPARQGAAANRSIVSEQKESVK